MIVRDESHFSNAAGLFGGVISFVCKLLRIVKIVTVDMMHELFDNYLLHQV